MNILAVNDDGYTGEGIKSLCRVLRKNGHYVVIMAPDGERSGYSHSMSLAKGYTCIKKVSPYTWKCDGTPVDCVLAVLAGGIEFKPDIVVSGINAGCNLGTDILFSGTDGAARQAALYGLPAIAFSLSGDPPWLWERASEWAADNFENLRKLCSKDIFINVNIPNTPDFEKIFSLTFPAKRSYFDTIEKTSAEKGWTKINFLTMTVETLDEAGSDFDVTQKKNCVSVSPVYIHPVVTDKFLTSAPEDRKVYT